MKAQLPCYKVVQFKNGEDTGHKIVGGAKLEKNLNALQEAVQQIRVKLHLA